MGMQSECSMDMKHSMQHGYAALTWNFLARMLAIKKDFAVVNDEKTSASAQRQATHTGKTSGRCDFCRGCNYNN
jgi:hypothetical protein